MARSDPSVLVTGVSGFIGAEVAKQLLQAGYRVRGTTRDVNKAVQDAHLTSLDGAQERLELVEANLLDPESITEAMTGCAIVLHVASPYALDVEDPQRDLVDPAVNGTLAILNAAAQTHTVKRIVLTSSFVAVMGNPDQTMFSEADWNETASLTHNAYAYSKTVAERSAWDFMTEETRQFDLVVINPPQVFGPTLVPRANQSHEWFIGLTNGSQPAIVGYDFPMVDVRDIAKVHILAMQHQKASGRYVPSSGNFTHRQVADIGRELGMADKYKMPRLRLDGRIGGAIARASLIVQPKGIRQWLLDTVGRRIEADNTKTIDEFDIEFIPVEVSIADTWVDLDRWGILGK